MPSVIRVGQHYKTVIPVDLAPNSHSVPSCSGNLLGKYADVYHFGAEVSSYQLSERDKIIIIADHKKPQPHIILLTHDANLINKMPGQRDCSLVSKVLTQVQSYITRSNHYPLPLTDWQIQKQEIAKELHNQLNQLFSQERNLLADNFEGRERLRNQIISLIEAARDENSRLANHPFVSTGELGNILYQCKRQAEDYEFNPFKQISKKDQGLYESDDQTCFVWDSVANLAGTNYRIDDCLQTIASHYQLKSNKFPKEPSRFMQFKQSFETYHRDAKDLADYLILPKKPEQCSYDEQSDNVQKTFVQPYYTFESPKANKYLNALSANKLHVLGKGESEKKFFQMNKNENACLSKNKTTVYLKLSAYGETSEIISYRCFIKHNKIHLLPTLDDLSAVTRASERHLYFPERVWIHFKLFLNHIPAWIKWIGIQTKRIAIEEVYEHLVEQVHRGHNVETKPKAHQHRLNHITKEIEKTLPEGVSFKQWIDKYLEDNHYLFVMPAKSTLPSLYNEPLHRVFNIADHAASFFVGLNEKHPVLGTVALSAYLFGGLSILAPNALESLLNKLHAHGLTHLIPIVKTIGETMSNGPMSQTISASMTLWQATMLAGQLDQATITALSALQESPAEIVIVASLAMGLGYALCNTIPYLNKEMGEFPYTNYAAVGAKGGAAIFDTVVHPGDDWLLGTIKWVLKGIRLAASLLVAPIIEGFYYGWENGFIYGLKKSHEDLLSGLKQVLAALVDMPLLISMFLLKHGAALFLHVPFRGVTCLLSTTIALFGHINDIANALINFSSNQFDPGSSFRLSPFYGYSPPVNSEQSHRIIDSLLNTTKIAIYIPFFVIKDYIVLPLSDMSSYMIRIGLASINQLCKAISFAGGYILLGISMITDPTIGRLCLNIADAITLSANFVDKQAGQLKRQALSQTQVQRCRLYRWAFANEETKYQSNRPQCKPTCQDPFVIDYLDSETPISCRI